MKKMNRKGFTIVELVIVIAVIAILAGVLIPTFSGIVNKANDSKALQEARNVYTAYTANLNYAGGDVAEQDIVVKVGTKYFAIADGVLSSTVYTDAVTAAKAAGATKDTNRGSGEANDCLQIEKSGELAAKSWIQITT